MSFIAGSLCHLMMPRASAVRTASAWPMTPPPATSMVTSIPLTALGTELTPMTPLPAFKVARAIAVLRFPLVLMIFTMVATLELCSEERADCTERDVARVVQTVHVRFFEHFHLLADEFDRNADVALDGLHRFNAAGAL